MRHPALPCRLVVRLRTLTPSTEVRILAGHPAFLPERDFPPAWRGGATSNATVSRSPAAKGTVPCHIVEGNSTSRPGLGSILRAGGSPSPSAAGGWPCAGPP